jgi:hypothetical protein
MEPGTVGARFAMQRRREPDRSAAPTQGDHQNQMPTAAGRGREGLTLPCMHGAYVRVHVQARRSGQERGAVMGAYTYMMQARPRQRACIHVQPRTDVSMMQARPRQRACMHVQVTHGRIYIQVPYALKASRSTALRRKSSSTTTTPVPLHEQVPRRTHDDAAEESEAIQATPTMQVQPRLHYVPFDTDEANDTGGRS